MVAGRLLVGVVAAWYLVATGRVASGGTRDKAEASVGLSTPRQSYVLGEPVLLDLVLTNTSGDPIRMLEVVADPCVALPEIKIFISGGARRSPWWWVRGDVVEMERRIERVEPGAQKRYRLRVLYDIKEPSHLAFPRPGRYWIRAIFPLVTLAPGRPADRKEIESNGIEMEVVAPKGIDARLWRSIQEGSFLRLLQFGTSPKLTALKVANWLRSISDSSYHDDLRWALAKWYYSYQWESARDRPSEEDMALIREVLGLDWSVEFGPPTDRRLDCYYVDKRWISHWYAKPISERPYGLDDLLAEITKRTGVPLRNDAGLFFPGISLQSLKNLKETVPLRRFMQLLADPGRTAWFRDGDGYVLRRIEPSAEPSQGDESEKSRAGKRRQ